jgi:hypothetical protein
MEILGSFEENSSRFFSSAKEMEDEESVVKKKVNKYLNIFVSEIFMMRAQALE